ncbi:HGGxSTG domain-containing protein [Sphingobium vermicomposti]|uniref:HGGxSTG domain-containing protein n=1 Tax=Sphingobium vermicomposti TaxID=529005 RepID=UPI003C79E2BD
MRLRSAPRCLAKTRQGTECQSPAIKGKRRCRMHGGNSPGAPRGNRNSYKHGLRSAAMVETRRIMRGLVAATKATIGGF